MMGGVRGGGGVIMHRRMLKEEVRVGQEGCVCECGSDVEDGAAATLQRGGGALKSHRYKLLEML